MTTLTEVNGRARKSIKAIRADWFANLDFRIEGYHPQSGRLTNRQDCIAMGETVVNIRYNNLRKLTSIKVEA